MQRTRVAEGVYRDAYGYEVRWRDGRPRSKRFPPDAPLDTLKAFRKKQQGDVRASAPQEGSFVRDAARFLATRRALASFKSERAHLRPWVHRFKRRSRWAITRQDVIAAVSEWARAGYSPRTLRHRVRVLEGLFQFLDQEPPTRGVKLPTPAKPRPMSVSPDLIREVARNLRRNELAGRLRDAKTRARYLVLATTGQRPAQVQRATLMDMDLERRIWTVRPAKNDLGATIYLNDDMLAAWKLFIHARAWGVYDARSFAKTLRRNGWPKGIRPYALRHSVGLSLSEAGVDLGDIQAHMGHTSPATTRQFYVPTVPERMKQASAKLTPRFGPEGLGGLPSSTATTDAERKAKEREKRRQSA